MVTLRLIKAALAGESTPYPAEQLSAHARHCTLREDNASTVERQVMTAVAAYLLDRRIGDVFDAIVTGAAANGTFVRISNPLLEGRVVRDFDRLDLGDALRVQLVALDTGKSLF